MLCGRLHRVGQRQKAPAPRPARSLSARLLALTVVFVMVAQALILLPSMGRAYRVGLDNRLQAAHLAALSVEAAPDNLIDDGLEERLLNLAGVELVSLAKPNQRALALMRTLNGPVIETIDLARLSRPTSAMAALSLVTDPHAGLIRVIGPSQKEPGTVIDIVMERTLIAGELRRTIWRLITESLAISLIAATFLFLALHWLLVRPMRRLTDSIAAFGADPERAPHGTPSLIGRRDEIGLAASELDRMQEALRAALWQKSRLAALGTAVTKINHDLRGVLATALLISDRLADSHDPRVRQAAPTLLAAIDRAVALCRSTLDFAREGPPALDIKPFALATLIDEVAGSLDLDRLALIENQVAPDRMVRGDREQLFRVILNLARNALEAGAQHVRLSADRGTASDPAVIIVSDDGPGLPPAVREHLFRPFLSGRRGGTGLGLAIANDIMRAHGGGIEIAHSGPDGTSFRLALPGEWAEDAPIEAARLPAPMPSGGR